MDKCMYCGKTYEEHKGYPIPEGSTPKIPCALLKSGFKSQEQVEESMSPTPNKPTVVAVTYLFSDALKQILEGKKITRVEWQNKKIFGQLVNGSLMLHKEDDVYYIWQLSDGDILADDWVVLD